MNFVKIVTLLLWTTLQVSCDTDYKEVKDVLLETEANLKKDKKEALILIHQSMSQLRASRINVSYSIYDILDKFESSVNSLVREFEKQQFLKFQQVNVAFNDKFFGENKERNDLYAEFEKTMNEVLYKAFEETEESPHEKFTLKEITDDYADRIGRILPLKYEDRIMVQNNIETFNDNLKLLVDNMKKSDGKDLEKITAGINVTYQKAQYSQINIRLLKLIKDTSYQFDYESYIRSFIDDKINEIEALKTFASSWQTDVEILFKEIIESQKEFKANFTKTVSKIVENIGDQEQRIKDEKEAANMQNKLSTILQRSKESMKKAKEQLKKVLVSYIVVGLGIVACFLLFVALMVLMIRNILSTVASRKHDEEVVMEERSLVENNLSGAYLWDY